MKGCLRLDNNSNNGIFGGIDFIKEKPALTVERSHAIWQYRVKNLMCPHCGNKTHRRDDQSRRIIALHVPGYVKHGICVHPECQPPHRVSIMYAPHDDDDDDDANDNSTTSSTVDTNNSDSYISAENNTTITIVEEYWKDIKKSLLKMQNLANQGKSCYELEDMVNQMTRAIMQAPQQQNHNLTQHFSEKQQSGIDKEGYLFQQQQSDIEELQQQVFELKTTEVAAMATVALEQIQNNDSFSQASDNSSSTSSVNKLGKFMNLMQNSIISLSSAMASVKQNSEDVKRQFKVLEQSVIEQLQKQVVVKQVQQTDFNQSNDSPRISTPNTGDYMPRIENSLLSISTSIASLQRDSHDLKQRLLAQQQTTIAHQQSVMEHLQRLELKMQHPNKEDTATPSCIIKTIPKTIATKTLTKSPAKITTTQCALDCFGTLEGHTGSIRCCTVFANNQRAITGSDDNTLRVWDLATRQTLLTLCGHSGAVWCCAVFGSVKYVVSGSSETTLHVWDLGTGQILRSLKGHTNTVMCCTIFANDQKVLTASWDTTLRVWELGSGRTLVSLKGHSSAVTCCAVFGNEKCALSGSRDKTLKVWDLSTGKIGLTLAGHEAAVMCCSVYDNDQFALSGSADKTLRVWNLSSGETVLTLKGHTKEVNCCTVPSIGQRAVSGSADKTLRVWDLTTGQALLTLESLEGIVGCCTLFASNKRLISGGSDNVLRVWDLKRKKDKKASKN